MEGEVMAKTKEQQAVLAKINGLRRYALTFLRETERGRFEEQTQRLLVDLGKLALTTAPETSVLLSAGSSR
jgi:hypothetical protein